MQRLRPSLSSCFLSWSLIRCAPLLNHVLNSDLLKNDAMDLFDGMFFDEVSHQIANSQGLGLLEWLNDISDRRENKPS